MNLQKSPKSKSNKNLLFVTFAIIIFVVIYYSQISNAQELDTEVAEIISKSYDLAYSGLQKESKTILIDAIYNPNYKNFETPLRFALGGVCYINTEYKGANYQWNIILENEPESEEATAIRFLYNIYGIGIEEAFSDIRFVEEYELSRLFWHKLKPNFKVDIEELSDPLLALEYLQHLSKRYETGLKKAIILYDQFLLIMGYNNDNFGYHCVKSSRSFSDYPKTCIEYYNKKKEVYIETIYNPKHLFLKEAEMLSDSLKLLKNGNKYYVRTQFLLAVSLAGQKFLSSKIKIKEESKPYLSNIISATEGDETNLFRIFAIKWLAELTKKE